MEMELKPYISTEDDHGCVDTLSVDEDDNVNSSKVNGAVEHSSSSHSSRTINQEYINDEDQEELHFDEVPISPSQQKKIKEIEDVLSETYVDEEKLRELALSEGGLVNDELRRRVWPKLLGIDTDAASDHPTQAELENHREYQQVVLDVNRSLKRFPPGIPYAQRVALQDQLTRLILRVIIKYPHLRYYQGYHDVAVTFLLVVGESAAFQIMEKLSTSHLKDCMEATMEKTSYLLNYIYPLIQRLHPSLYDYMERSEVGTMFCLPWFLTWYGHSLNKYRDVVRLYDFFLASPPLMPLYLAAALVVHRASEIFAVDCDMASIHSLLSVIPDDLDFEQLLEISHNLYEQYPPESIEAEVSERAKREFQGRNALSHRRIPQNHYLWRWIEWHRFFPYVMRVVNPAAPYRRYTRYFAVSTFFSTLVVIYAYFRVADAYDCDLISPIR